MKLSASDYNRIRAWMLRNARLLDLSRWNFHLEGGAQSDVLNALSAYQNPDGGFGHALEADSWNPHSSPIQTSTAMDILREINFWDGQHPTIRGTLAYLDSRADMADNRWRSTVLSNNDYPHALWWHTDSASTSHSEYNPTAILVGFILCFADRESGLYRKGFDIAQQLAASFLVNPELEMHPLLCVAALVDYIDKAELQDEFHSSRMREAVYTQVNRLIRRDANNWGGYSFRPSEIIRSLLNPLYQENRDLVEKELDYLLSTRNTDGIWDITWNWNQFEREFAISENWWKAHVAIRNILFLAALGRIEGFDLSQGMKP